MFVQCENILNVYNTDYERDRRLTIEISMRLTPFNFQITGTSITDRLLFTKPKNLYKPIANRHVLA